MKKILLKIAKVIADKYGYSLLEPRLKYTVTTVTAGGETIPFIKTRENKRHSKNTRILAWNLYEGGKLTNTVNAKQK